MAFSPDELEQIRQIVRSELQQRPSSFGPVRNGGTAIITVFLCVLALHVLVIGGLTAYHLFHSH